MKKYYRFFYAALTLWVMVPNHCYALTYQEAVTLALENAPQLQASKSVVDAQDALQISAGRLPDPTLLIGIENVPISGNDAYSTTNDFMTMQKVGIMQEIPNADKRKAEQKKAAADSELAATQLDSVRLNLQRDTTLAWVTLYYLQQKRDVLATQTRDNQLLVDSLHIAVQSGKNNANELLQAKQESDEIADSRDLLELEITKAKNQLARFIGASANKALSGKPPQFNIDVSQLEKHLASHPELAQFNAITHKANAQLQEAMADKQSDWGVEVAYQKRGDAFDDMMSLEFSVGLPLFTSTRQNPRIAAKQAALTQVAFERETLYREHNAALNNDSREYETIKKQLLRLQNSRLPLAEKSVAEALARYRSGQEELNSVITAKRMLYDITLQKIDLLLARDAIQTRLHYLVGESS